MFWFFFSEDAKFLYIHFLHMFHTKIWHAFLPWDHLFIRVRSGGGQPTASLQQGSTPLCCSMVHGGFQLCRFGETTVNKYFKNQSCWYVFATYSHPMSLKGIICLHAPKKVPYWKSQQVYDDASPGKSAGELFWDGEFTWPFGKVKWPSTFGDKRSRLESPGLVMLI